MGLNTKQIEAVEHVNGPLLIIAGAGSGKTTVLSHRAKQLVETEGISPQHIWCVTFTNKAVDELRQRIIKQIGTEKGEKVYVSTFHAFARLILENEWKKDFAVTHTSESRQLIKKIVDEMDIKNESEKTFLLPSKLMKIISLLKSELVTIQFLEQGKVLREYIDATRVKQILAEEVGTKENLQLLRHVYRHYQQKLNNIGKIDVDDLLVYATRILAEKPTILNKYQERFQYLMIDEYQDTNRSQYIISKLLAGKYRNICAVGDDFQSIYKFRGSDIRNILQFDQDFPDYKEIKLEENYRSTKIIVQAANQIIAHNPDQKEKTLFTNLEDGEKIRLHAAQTSLDEARFIAQRIKELVAEGFAYRDISIFYRNNAESSHFETVFPQEDIPYMITKESSFFERKEIKDVLSYLQFITNTTDEFSFTQCINTPKRGIGATSVQRFIEHAKGNDILSVLEHPTDIKLNKNATQGVQAFVEVIKKYQRAKETMTVSQLITSLLADIQYKESFADLEVHLKNEKISYLNQLIEIAKQLEFENNELTLSQFVSELSKRDVDADLAEEEDFNKVNLLTVHSSKGLEFPVVFLTGMKEQGFPSKFASTTQAIEEERRLCYVAFTRAKQQLFLTYPKTSLIKDEQNPKEKIEVNNEPSRFLHEFDSSLVQKI